MALTTVTMCCILGTSIYIFLINSEPYVRSFEGYRVYTPVALTKSVTKKENMDSLFQIEFSRFGCTNMRACWWYISRTTFHMSTILSDSIFYGLSRFYTWLRFAGKPWFPMITFYCLFTYVVHYFDRNLLEGASLKPKKSRTSGQIICLRQTFHWSEHEKLGFMQNKFNGLQLERLINLKLNTGRHTIATNTVQIR